MEKGEEESLADDEIVDFADELAGLAPSNFVETVSKVGSGTGQDTNVITVNQDKPEIPIVEHVADSVPVASESPFPLESLTSTPISQLQSDHQLAVELSGGAGDFDVGNSGGSSSSSSGLQTGGSSASSDGTETKKELLLKHLQALKDILAKKSRP